MPKILTGSWRITDEAKAADAERIAEGKRTMPIFAKLMPAMKAQDWAKALSVVEEAVAVLPDDVSFRVLDADLLLHKMHDLQAGMPVMRQFVRDAVNKKSALWMAGAMRQLFNPANDNSHLPQGERFAMGKELSEHILAVNPPQRGEAPKFLSYPAVAQYYYESSNKDRAIELIEVMLESLAYPERTETAGYGGIGPSAGQLQRSEGVLWGSLCDSAARSVAKYQSASAGGAKMKKGNDLSCSLFNSTSHPLGHRQLTIHEHGGGSFARPDRREGDLPSEVASGPMTQSLWRVIC
ncbi:hypothetical protein [Bradyrhizobium sp. Ghvi]|uniref:hypothetical protein n=1 Tax=Bradyrhizobium sp. Ghvi TaxID=1855319 RepID=UPI0032DFE1D2